MSLRTLFFLLLSAGALAAQVPVAVDLNAGAAEKVKLAGGRTRLTVRGPR